MPYPWEGPVSTAGAGAPCVSCSGGGGGASGAGTAAAGPQRNTSPRRRPVGWVRNATAGTTIDRGGEIIKVVRGTPVFEGDVLRTEPKARLRNGPEAKVEVGFANDQVMSFGPDTEVVVDEYLYAPAKGDRKFEGLVGRGTLNDISGKIQKLRPTPEPRTDAAFGSGFRG